MAMDMDRNDMDYAGEEILLGGKIRHIKYTIPGLKMLARHFGTVVDGLNAFEGFNPLFDEAGLDKMAKLTHAGLVHEDRALTLEAVENMIDVRVFQILPSKLLDSLNSSIPQRGSSGDDGNPT